MEIDMLTVETDKILCDMKKIKKLCYEAYNKTDDDSNKEKIRLLYEGKMLEKIKMFGHSMVHSMDKAYANMYEFDKWLFQGNRKLGTQIAQKLKGEADFKIQNYRELNLKEYYNIKQKLKVVAYLSKLKSSNDVDMNDPGIANLLETAKNISKYKKEWASKLMSAPKTVNYNDVAAVTRGYAITNYKPHLTDLTKQIESVRDASLKIANSSKGTDANTLKVMRAAVTVTRALADVAVAAVNKDISNHKKIFSATSDIKL